MTGSTLKNPAPDPAPVAVDDFLEQLLPEAVAAVSDPDTLERLEPRQLLTYTLQILHADLCPSVEIDTGDETGDEDDDD
jgi:hypothetical protein